MPVVNARTEAASTQPLSMPCAMILPARVRSALRPCVPSDPCHRRHHPQLLLHRLRPRRRHRPDRPPRRRPVPERAALCCLACRSRRPRRQRWRSCVRLRPRRRRRDWACRRPPFRRPACRLGTVAPKAQTKKLGKRRGRFHVTHGSYLYIEKGQNNGLLRDGLDKRPKGGVWRHHRIGKARRNTSLAHKRARFRLTDLFCRHAAVARHRGNEQRPHGVDVSLKPRKRFLESGISGCPSALRSP